MIAAILFNWPWKLLSLAIALAIWLFVNREPEIATVVTTAVEMKNAPRQLEVSSPMVSSVKLELSGISGRLHFNPAPPPVILDMSAVKNPGERTFNIDSHTVRLPPGVHLDRAVPAQIRFVFEKQVRKTVPVRIRWNGDLPARAEISVEPSNLVVVGPESRVNLVDSVATDPVNAASAARGATMMTSPFIDEPQVRFADFHPIRVRVMPASGSH